MSNHPRGRQTEKCKSISMKIRSIAQYSHKSTLKKAISWCTKKDVILSSPLKPGARRALIKIWPGDSKKSAISGPTPPPPKTADFEKGGVHGPKSAKTARIPLKADLKTGGGPIGGGGPTPHQKILSRVPPLLRFEVLVLPGRDPPQIVRFQQTGIFQTPPRPKKGGFCPPNPKMGPWF